MNPEARAAFVASYGRLVTRVWSDPDLELLLEQDTRGVMAQYGLTLPDPVRVDLVRSAPGVQYSLDDLVATWESAADDGHFALVIPATDVDDAGELAEHELDAIVAGLGPSACCSPCCCTA
jgi:hypothetical protein